RSSELALGGVASPAESDGGSLMAGMFRDGRVSNKGSFALPVLPLRAIRGTIPVHGRAWTRDEQAPSGLGVRDHHRLHDRGGGGRTPFRLAGAPGGRRPHDDR